MAQVSAHMEKVPCGQLHVYHPANRFFQLAFCNGSEKIYQPAKPQSHKIHLGKASHLIL